MGLKTFFKTFFAKKQNEDNSSEFLAEEMNNDPQNYNDSSSSDISDLENSKTDEERFNEFKMRAENGEALFMTDLGLCYIEGTGTPKDMEKALYWTRMAAELKDPMGIHNLGWFYREGILVSKDLEKALNLYLEASSLGLSRASYNIGLLYHEGNGVEQNYETAAIWYKKALEQDNPFPPAYKNLSNLYRLGLGVNQDDFESIRLLDEGAKTGFKECEEALRWYLFDIYIKGISWYYGKNSTHDEKEKGYSYIHYASTFRFLPAMKWALINDEDTFISPFMGTVFRDIKQIDYVDITRMFLNNPRFSSVQELLARSKKGTENGDSGDMCYLALMKLFVKSLEHTDIDAINLLLASARFGYTNALFWLGYCYEFGISVDKNLELAKAYYYEVIKKGYSEFMWLNSGMVFQSDDDRALAESHLHLSQLLFNEGKYDDAQSLLALNYGECKNHTPSLYLMSKIYREKGELDKANSLLFECVKMGHSESFLDISKLFLEKNDYIQFEEYCIKSIMMGNIDAVFLWQDYYAQHKC